MDESSFIVRGKTQIVCVCWGGERERAQWRNSLSVGSKKLKSLEHVLEEFEEPGPWEFLRVCGCV